MQQHYEIINLHNIIKTQESKIHELREELRIANEREETRYDQMMKNSQIKVDQKQKMIQYLKDELQKQKSSRYEDLGLQRSKYERDHEGVQKQLITYKKKCIELQGKLRRTENDSENKIQDITNNYLKISEEIADYNKSKNYLTIEISKLNHFYKNSIFEISKRKQTLLWVEKFTDYLENSQEKEKKTLCDVNNFVKSELQNLRNQLSMMVDQVTKCERGIAQRTIKAQEEIRQYLSDIQADYSKVMEENQHYWNNVIKTEKQSQRNEEIKALKSQLETARKELEIQTEGFQEKAKIYEAEKKTLILGFQELRSLNEQRQNNYRQQIKALKGTVKELMERGEERDKQFEDEIKGLTGQIQQISQRYYENIDYPIKKINDKIALQTEKANKQLKNLRQNPVFIDYLKKIENISAEYFDNSYLADTKLKNEIEEYISHSTTLLGTITQLLRCDRNFQKPISSQQYQSETQKEQMQIENRQRFNKSLYDASLAKKHLLKLQQHCQNLQKKNPVSSKQKNQLYLKKRILELQAENEALKQNCEALPEMYRKQIKEIQMKWQGVIGQYENASNTNRFIIESIDRMEQMNQKLEIAMRNEEKIYKFIKNSLEILMQPIENLHHLYRELKEINEESNIREKTVSLAQHEQTFNESTTKKYFNFHNNDEIKHYKDILFKRQENVNSTQRLLTDLIKTMREIQYKSNKIQQGNKTNEQHHKADKINKGRGVEKKIRELQTQKIKDRQEFSKKLQKLGSQIQTISAKQQKSSSLKNTLNKFELNVDSKVEQVIKKMQMKLDKSEINVIKQEVIADLRSKLNEANVENEGLRKQMSLQYAIKN